jgi:integrase
LKLTENAILKLTCPPGKKDVLVSDDDQRGLYVRVGANAIKGKAGGRGYLAQYTYDGRKRRIPLSATTLALARTAAAAIMGDVARGHDPVASRKAAVLEARRKAAHVELTLKALIERWEALDLADKRQSYRHEAVRALRRAFVDHLKAPAADLARSDVVEIIDALKLAKKPAMASTTVRYGSAMYSWALRRGSIATSPFVNLDVPPTTKRERTLSDDELKAIWAATAKPGSYNSIVRLLALTGQREGEVAGLTWSELNDDLTVWRLPAARAKNRREHIVPLAPQVRAIIEGAPRYANKLLFPGRDGVFNGWGQAKRRLDRDSGVESWTLHDLRRTCATNLQKLGVRLEVTESVLNHVGGSRGGIVGVYQRHDWADEKRAALEAWGARVAEIVEGREPARNVTPIRALSA